MTRKSTDYSQDYQGYNQVSLEAILEGVFQKIDQPVVYWQMSPQNSLSCSGIPTGKAHGVQVAAGKTMPLTRAAIYLLIYQKLHDVQDTT